MAAGSLQLAAELDAKISINQMHFAGNFTLHVEKNRCAPGNTAVTPNVDIPYNRIIVVARIR